MPFSAARRAAIPLAQLRDSLLVLVLVPRGLLTEAHQRLVGGGGRRVVHDPLAQRDGSRGASNEIADPGNDRNLHVPHPPRDQSHGRVQGGYRSGVRDLPSRSEAVETRRRPGAYSTAATPDTTHRYRRDISPIRCGWRDSAPGMPLASRAGNKVSPGIRNRHAAAASHEAATCGPKTVAGPRPRSGSGNRPMPRSGCTQPAFRAEISPNSIHFGTPPDTRRTTACSWNATSETGISSPST